MFPPGVPELVAHIRQANRAGVSSGDGVPQTVSLKPDGGGLVGGWGAERLA
jgi:hypothetical protein